MLDSGGSHPPLATIDQRPEFIDWTGESKDLAFVPGVAPGDIVIVDDDAGWIRPDQRARWVPIAAWDGGPDGELRRVRAELEARLGEA